MKKKKKTFASPNVKSGGLPWDLTGDFVTFIKIKHVSDEMNEEPIW